MPGTNPEVPMEENAKTLGEGDSIPNSQQFVEWTISGETFPVKNRFDSLSLHREGSFGPIYKANDAVTKAEVAIKRINDPFLGTEHVRRLLRELKLLKFVNHDCLMSLVDAYTTTATHSDSMTHLYLVTPFLEADLHQIIQLYRDDNQFLTPEHIQFFVYQILMGLNYLHSANITHMDLKPSTVFVNNNCDIKITGFRFYAKVESNREICSKIECRWYRAPETMISEQLSCAVDMWAVGCILGELLLARPVFPAVDYLELLKKQIYICGSLDEETMQIFKHPKGTVEFIRNKFSGHPRVDFSDYFKSSDQCTDLLEQLLQINPNSRPSAKEALSHPYFNDIYEPEDEEGASGTFDDSFEDIATMAELRRAIFKEISIITNSEFHGNVLTNADAS